MRKFTDNELLINSVHNNDVKEVKRLLIDNIIFLQGNKEEINKAVEYAIEKSNFIFDEHISLSVENADDKEDLFSEEKFNMRENYSKERYNLLVDLYHETFAKNEYVYETSTTKTDNTKIAKAVAVGLVVIIAGYLFYKILD